MKKLNKKFRNRNKSTDVLSFPFLSSNNLKFTKQKKYYKKFIIELTLE